MRLIATLARTFCILSPNESEQTAKKIFTTKQLISRLIRSRVGVQKAGIHCKGIKTTAIMIIVRPLSIVHASFGNNGMINLEETLV